MTDMQMLHLSFLFDDARYGCGSMPNLGNNKDGLLSGFGEIPNFNQEKRWDDSLPPGPDDLSSPRDSDNPNTPYPSPQPPLGGPDAS